MQNRVALLDNTIQVDRVKMASRQQSIETLLEEFDYTVTTSICLLEFKATIVQACITIHNCLRSVGLYTRVVDRLTESPHPQAKLRGHILRNHVNVFACSSFDVTEAADRRLAEKCRLLLEVKIPELYRWFSESVVAVLTTGIDCTRASDQPVKERDRASFGVNLPVCKRGENKFCKVEAFIRTKAAPLLDRLEEHISKMPEADSEQLRKTRDLIRQVIADDEIELSHSQCRRAGDFLIALEGMDHGTHALSTNAREWAVVSEIAGMEFVRVTYPDK